MSAEFCLFFILVAAASATLYLAIQDVYPNYTRDLYSDLSYMMVQGSLVIRGGADKFLAPPGMKQATATKLGIYSTYSPRSSIHSS